MLNIFNHPANDKFNLGPNYYTNANIVFTPNDLDDEVEELSIDTSGFKLASTILSNENCLNLFTREYNRTVVNDRFRLTPSNLLEICSALFSSNWTCLKKKRELALLRDMETILDLYVSRLRWCVCIKKSSSDISDELQVHHFMKTHAERTNVEFLFSVVNPIIVTHAEAHKAIQMFGLLTKTYKDIEQEHAHEKSVSLVAIKYSALNDFIDLLIAELESLSWSTMRCDCFFEMLALLAFEACLPLEGLEFYKRRFDDDFVADLEVLYNSRNLTLPLRDAVKATKFANPSVKKALSRLYAFEA
jgi:hypothetical protein